MLEKKDQRAALASFDSAVHAGTLCMSACVVGCAGSSRGTANAPQAGGICDARVAMQHGTNLKFGMSAVHNNAYD